VKNTNTLRREARQGFRTPSSTLQANSGDIGAIIDDYALARIDYRVRQLWLQFDLSEHDKEDVHHDMVVELLQAMKRFNPAKAKRETFINRVLDRFVLYIMRQRCTRIRRPSDSPLGFEDVSEGFQPCDNDPGQGETSEQDLRDLRLDLPEIIALLPDDLQRVCFVLQRTSGRAAAKELGIGKSTLYRAIADIRQHFVDHGYTGFPGDSWDTSAPGADVEGAQNENEVPQ
jgi:RNA polymerase sigma-70 factor (ECF subfamily)